MRARAAALAGGVAAALRSPFWLGRGRLLRLIGDCDPIPAPHAERAIEHQAVRAAHATLRILGRVPFPLWRNTCLYRAVAECLVLRRYGVPCRLELGVTRSGDGAAIGAHAWVVRADARTEPSAAAMIVLR
jgi:hypothetical protein